MSDLISRSELIKIIKGTDELLDFQKDECIICINACDIAYDIDVVVGELEERKALHERLVDYETKNGTVTEKYQHIKAIDVLNDAIEIVKQGGVSDDVCEWTEYDYKTIRSPHERDWSIPSMKDFKYCPYCGKKIKVVE